MKLLTFKLQGEEFLGALTDAGVVNLNAAAPEDLAFSSMQQFIEAVPPALDRAYALLASSPVSTPSDQVGGVPGLAGEACEARVVRQPGCPGDAIRAHEVGVDGRLALSVSDMPSAVDQLCLRHACVQLDLLVQSEDCRELTDVVT